MNDAARCVNHGQHATRSCISCHLPLCESCDRFDINSRPWCHSCGYEHVPGASSTLKSFAKISIKIFCVIFSGLLITSLVPGIYGLIGAVAMMTLVGKFLFVRDKIPDARIEEYRNGVCVRG